MERQLSNRCTTITFDDFCTENFSVLNRLDQGDPLSRICYLIYNTDLLKIPDIKKGECMLLFIDDVAIIIMGKDFKETHEKLQDIMNHTEGIFTWAKLHNCEFIIKKFQLLDITKKLDPHPFNPRRKITAPWHALTLGNQCIPSKESMRFLEVMINNRLNWKAQYATTLTKGQEWLIQFSRIAHTSKGVHAKYFCQLYLSITIPQMLYATDIFLTPKQNIGKNTENNKAKQAILTKLTSIQQQAAIMITGAMSTTATDALEVMANILPFHMLVDKHHHQAALRLVTLPTSHPLHKPVRNAAKNLVKHHPTPLYDLMH